MKTALKDAGVKEDVVKFTAKRKACYYNRDKRDQTACPSTKMFDPEAKDDPNTSGKKIYSGTCAWMPDGQMPPQKPSTSGPGSSHGGSDTSDKPAPGTVPTG